MELKELTRDEIIERLKLKEVGSTCSNGQPLLPLCMLYAIVDYPVYNPGNFVQEIEDSEVEINVFDEIKKQMSKPDFDFVWNNTIGECKKNSERWYKNHTKKCIVTTHCFGYVCSECHKDGTRNYYTDEVMKKIEEFLTEGRKIYNI